MNERTVAGSALTDAAGDAPKRPRGLPGAAGRDDSWVIVLAGGDGQRVSAWTTDPAGRPVPKQYCSFGRSTSMLRWALDRACSIVPRLRVLTVVAQQHRRLWERELSDLPPENVVVQPRNRGTAVGLLLPLLRVAQRHGASAPVAVLPSDHFVADERRLRRALTAALSRTRHSNRVHLLGMTPSSLDPEYGWVLPRGPTSSGIVEVAEFVEKPGCDRARDLVARGALLNSMMLAARAGALLGLFRERLPETLDSLLTLLGEGSDQGLAGLYDSLPTSDFSRDILERSARRLSVVRVPDCGWSDLGTPARLQAFGALSDTRDRLSRGPGSLSPAGWRAVNAGHGGLLKEAP